MLRRNVLKVCWVSLEPPFPLEKADPSLSSCPELSFVQYKVFVHPLGPQVHQFFWLVEVAASIMTVILVVGPWCCYMPVIGVCHSAQETTCSCAWAAGKLHEFLSSLILTWQLMPSKFNTPKSNCSPPPLQVVLFQSFPLAEGSCWTSRPVSAILALATAPSRASVAAAHLALASVWWMSTAEHLLEANWSWCDGTGTACGWGLVHLILLQWRVEIEIRDISDIGCLEPSLSSFS